MVKKDVDQGLTTAGRAASAACLLGHGLCGIVGKPDGPGIAFFMAKSAASPLRAWKPERSSNAPRFTMAKDGPVREFGMSQERVLVVDDEVYILHILDFILGAESYEVVTATDGEQALQRVREDKPDLVILDIMMPKLDGYETCRIIKQDEETKHIPVILLTAKGREIDQKLGEEVGASDYITKPFSPAKLIERVQSILGVRR